MVKKSDDEILPDRAARLVEARKARGFEDAKAATRYFDWVYDTYAQHENGTRGIVREAAKYAKAFRVSEGWLLTGEGRGPSGASASAAERAPQPDSAPKGTSRIPALDETHRTLLAETAIEICLAATGANADPGDVRTWVREALRSYEAKSEILVLPAPSSRRRTRPAVEARKAAPKGARGPSPRGS